MPVRETMEELVAVGITWVREAGRGAVRRVVSPVSEPDQRFTLANERTFLAWLRTSLALDAAAVGVSLVPDFGPPGTGVVLGTMIAALGVAVAVGALWRWRQVQRAMERGDALPRTWMPLLLGTGLGLVGVAIVVLFLLAA